nr:uncharacterized protein KIAA1211-like homolog [Vicugna pacos]
MKVPEAPSTFTKMAAFYQCIKPDPSELEMISTRVMDIKLREAAEGLGEDGTGKKKSKFKTFKKFFGKKKRKESPSSAGGGTWKQSQAKNEVIAIESGPVGYDSEDELEESRGALGSRALSHDSIFIPESGQDPARPVRVFSQENVCDRIKALQLKIQCNVKMGPPPPPGDLPAQRGDDAGMSSEDDGLPRSPPEMSLLQDTGPGTTIKVSVASSSPPQSPHQLFSRHASDTSVSPRTSDSAGAPVADFAYPPESSSCLDNSAAKHKLLVKPRNQRSSKMRRLSSRAQSESLSDLTGTPEEEEYDEKPLPKVSTEEKPSSGQQEVGPDRGPEPGGLATMLPPPGGARARRRRLQHCPALSASTEEDSLLGDNPSSRPATPEVTEAVSGPASLAESPSGPEGSPHPNHREAQREELSQESTCSSDRDTADEVDCASGDGEGQLSPCILEGDTTPPEPGPATTLETLPSPHGPEHPGQKEVQPVLDVPGREGAGPETPAPAPSPQAPKSCLKRKAPAVTLNVSLGAAPSPAASESLPQEPAPRSPDLEALRGSGPRASAEAPSRSSSAPRLCPSKHREAPGPDGRGIKRYSAEVRLEKGGLTLLSRDDRGPLGTGPAARGARTPNEQGKAKARSAEQLSSKPPLPRKPLLQTLTLPQLPAPPDTSPGDLEKVGAPSDPRKENQPAERKSPHRGIEKAAEPGADGQPVPPWVTVGRQKRRGAPEKPPSQEDKPGARTLKSETGRAAKAPERAQEPVKQADFVRSKSFLMAPAKPAADQRPGAKLRLPEGLQRGISLSHQNLAQSAGEKTEKELHQLKRASYASMDQPSWMELARKKSQAWSDMPQIIK